MRIDNSQILEFLIRSLTLTHSIRIRKLQNPLYMREDNSLILEFLKKLNLFRIISVINYIFVCM